jgi:SAM-dependent methyltransferase
MSETYFIKREFCPVCKSENNKTIYSCDFLEPAFRKFLYDYYAAGGGIEFEYLKDAKYVLDECNDCGLIYQQEVPNDALMIKLYEEWMNPKKNLDHHEKTDDLNYYSEYAHEIMRLITYFNRIPSTLRFLDFGMGLAKWALMAKAFGCDTYGMELSETKIKHARECGIKVISHNEIMENQFDFINVDQVVEHIREPLQALNHLKKFLKVDGLIKVCVPDGGDIKRRLEVMDWKAPRWTKNSLHPVHPLEHINCFNRNSLLKMTEIAALEPVEIPKARRFPLIIKENPLNSKNPKNIFKTLRKEWRNNFNWSATYLFFRIRT